MSATYNLLKWTADYTGEFAIVQSNNFTTLFVLSREREVEDSVLDVSFSLPPYFVSLEIM